MSYFYLLVFEKGSYTASCTAQQSYNRQLRHLSNRQTSFGTSNYIPNRKHDRRLTQQPSGFILNQMKRQASVFLSKMTCNVLIGI